MAHITWLSSALASIFHATWIFLFLKSPFPADRERNPYKMRGTYYSLFFWPLFWVVNTEIKTRITVHAVELHISRAHTVAALKICANFPISVNIIWNFIRMWILRTNTLQYVHFIVINTQFYCKLYWVLLYLWK
jgi:hypothetical protein